ncbi:MAG: LpxA family transferase [Chlamydiales bacterium]
MVSFSTAQLFDLTAFQHRTLFDCEFVWEALAKIPPYLALFPLGEIKGEVEPGAFLVHPELISLGEGSVIEAGAYVIGPCIIGKKCEVRHGAYIRGNVITGDHCVIGHATEVKNSIFLNGAQAGHFAYVGDSILGNKVNLGAGTKCANLRLDRRKVPIVFGKERIDTGLRKLGAILGDEVQTGCNSVTNPGTIMGKKSLCVACSTPTGVIPPKTIIKNEQNRAVAP